MNAPKKSETTRNTILQHGNRLVQKRGFAALGLQEILSASGVPKGSFYHYFTSKEAFGVVLLQRYVDEYEQRLAPFPSDVTGRTWLMHYFRGWTAVNADLREPGWAEDCLVVKLAAEVADLSEEMRRVLGDGTRRLIARLAQVIDAGRADGSIRSGRGATELAETLYQMWLGAALLARLTRSAEPFERALDATESLLGSGIEDRTPPSTVKL